MLKPKTALVLVMFLSTIVHAQVDSLKPWYKPANISMQFAGNVGMFSISPTWDIGNKPFNIGVSFGYVPKLEAQKAIYISALKVAYAPKLSFKIKKMTLTPFNAGLVSSYTFGERFNKYPKRSYWWNTAFRFGVFNQTALSIPIDSKHIHDLALYFEVSSWDLDIYSYGGNSNYKQLSAWSLIIFGFGTKLYLK